MNVPPGMVAGRKKLQVVVSRFRAFTVMVPQDRAAREFLVCMYKRWMLEMQLPVATEPTTGSLTSTASPADLRLGVKKSTCNGLSRLKRWVWWVVVFVEPGLRMERATEVKVGVAKAVVRKERRRPVRRSDGDIFKFWELR